MDRTQLISNARNNLAGLGRGNLGVPLLLLVMLAMMMLPIPPFLLDVFFTFNIALSIVVLLVCVYALRPLDFAAFPTILLVATLLRLALNVASTRVVMLHGQEGHGAAGKVIQAFGEVVIGGNYVVGAVVFAILMIINFVVVTKGAGRISEVSARFTLDAMPGKQMAIDADLNAGLIDQAQAKHRRAEVAQEAEFYGSMDGASKFVRGDAIAGLLILFINLIGGILIGMMQHGMSFTEAGKVYALLTIGDGLVAQLPSLLLSTAAAIMVTRASGSEDMGKLINRQMFDSPKALAVSGGLMIVMGLVPGMPHVAFLSLGLLAGGGAYLVWKKQQQAKVKALEEAQRQQDLLPSPQRALETKELGWDDVTPIDMIGLEVGYRLIPLVDRNQGGQLLARIKGVRKKLSQDLGFLMPTVHIYGAWISPMPIALTTACTLLAAPSLARMLLMWNVTVRSEMLSCSPISLAVRPSLVQLSTSRSRLVSEMLAAGDSFGTRNRPISECERLASQLACSVRLLISAGVRRSERRAMVNSPNTPRAAQLDCATPTDMPKSRASRQSDGCSAASASGQMIMFGLAAPSRTVGSISM